MDAWTSTSPHPNIAPRLNQRCPHSKWQRTPPQSKSACACRWPTTPPKTRPPNFCGPFCLPFGTTPQIASAKPPTTRPPSTPQCAQASIGSWAHFKCGMQRVCRSEEHTSELQSLRHLVCRLLLEKKKK